MSECYTRYFGVTPGARGESCSVAFLLHRHAPPLTSIIIVVIMYQKPPRALGFSVIAFALVTIVLLVVAATICFKKPRDENPDMDYPLHEDEEASNSSSKKLVLGRVNGTTFTMTTAQRNTGVPMQFP